MPPDLKSQLAEIVAKAERGEFARAERAARDYLDRRPGEEMAWSVLGYSQLRQRRTREAAATYLQAARRFPENPLHWNNLGTARRQSGEMREAEEAYAKALRLQPDNPQFVANMGLLYLELKRVVAARDYLWRAVQLDPSDYEARIFGCQMCLECGDEDRAAQILGNWESWVGNIDGSMRVELAAMLLRIGRNADGEALLRKQLEDPQSGDMARARLVVTLERFNRIDEARALVERLPDPETVDDPDLSGEIKEALAVMAVRGKDPAHARTLLEALLASLGSVEHRAM